MSGVKFQSPLGEVVKETEAEGYLNPVVHNCPKFQSPLGEVVKETSITTEHDQLLYIIVSIPSRGSGKGD